MTLLPPPPVLGSHELRIRFPPVRSDMVLTMHDQRKTELPFEIFIYVYVLLGQCHKFPFEIFIYIYVLLGRCHKFKCVLASYKSVVGAEPVEFHQGPRFHRRQLADQHAEHGYQPGKRGRRYGASGSFRFLWGRRREAERQAGGTVEGGS